MSFGTEDRMNDGLQRVRAHDMTATEVKVVDDTESVPDHSIDRTYFDKLEAKARAFDHIRDLSLLSGAQLLQRGFPTFGAAARSALLETYAKLDKGPTS